MSILVHFEPAGMTAAQYDKTISDLEKSGQSMKGVEYHACYGTDGDLRVIEVWSSPEEFEAFGKVLMPMLDDAGITMAKPPEISEIHNTMS